MFCLVICVPCPRSYYSLCHVNLYILLLLLLLLLCSFINVLQNFALSVIVLKMSTVFFMIRCGNYFRIIDCRLAFRTEWNSDVTWDADVRKKFLIFSSTKFSQAILCHNRWNICIFWLDYCNYISHTRVPSAINVSWNILTNVMFWRSRSFCCLSELLFLRFSAKGTQYTHQQTLLSLHSCLCNC